MRKQRAWFFVFALLHLAVIQLYGEESVSVVSRRFLDLCQATIDSLPKSAFAFEGQDGWLFARAELTHFAAGAFWGHRSEGVSKSANSKWADPLAAILDFNKRLQGKGIELVFLPVPAKAAIYPDKLSDSIVVDPKDSLRRDEYHERFYDLLEEEGVTVLDPGRSFFAVVRPRSIPCTVKPTPTGLLTVSKLSRKCSEVLSKVRVGTSR